jgi:Lrp/AsnC family transcriptional regulator, leucine-responsive regulatory protein
VRERRDDDLEPDRVSRSRPAASRAAGPADYLLEAVVPDLAAYERLLLDTLRELPGVTDIRSNIAIRTFKEASPLPIA